MRLPDDFIAFIDESDDCDVEGREEFVKESVLGKSGAYLGIAKNVMRSIVISI